MRHTSLHKVGLKSTVADFEVGDNRGCQTSDSEADLRSIKSTILVSI